MTDKELEDKTYEADVLWLMDNPRGRRFVWDLLSKCGVYSTSFTTNGSLVMFKEGRRDVGLRLLNELQMIAPDEFMIMWRECSGCGTFQPHGSQSGKGEGGG